MLIAEADYDLTEREFQLVSDLVYRHCGINLHDGKKELVRARMAKHIRSGGFRSVAAYLEHVNSEPSREAFHSLIDSISTNLTSFFRERQHFDHLSGKFLPALAERKRKAGANRIRAWSAGCSTGQEPYSLTITLLEALGTAWDMKLLATDISRRVLQTARQGIYEKTKLDGVSTELRAKYFPTLEGNRAVTQASAQLRSLIQFNYLNLMEPWPFSGPFDFIFCRNVMIYFDKPTQERLINRYYDCLDSGGLLFTGHSESLTGVSHKFRYVQPTIYAKP
jgi:chemotaxis protein methyltransferase CheR